MNSKVDYGREPDYSVLRIKIVCQTNRPAQVTGSGRADLFGAGQPCMPRTWPGDGRRLSRPRRRRPRRCRASPATRPAPSRGARPRCGPSRSRSRRSRGIPGLRERRAKDAGHALGRTGDGERAWRRPGSWCGSATAIPGPARPPGTAGTPIATASRKVVAADRVGLELEPRHRRVLAGCDRRGGGLLVMLAACASRWPARDAGLSSFPWR